MDQAQGYLALRARSRRLRFILRRVMALCPEGIPWTIGTQVQQYTVEALNSRF